VAKKNKIELKSTLFVYAILWIILTLIKIGLARSGMPYEVKDYVIGLAANLVMLAAAIVLTRHFEFDETHPWLIIPTTFVVFSLVAGVALNSTWTSPTFIFANIPLAISFWISLWAVPFMAVAFTSIYMNKR